MASALESSTTAERVDRSTARASPYVEGLRTSGDLLQLLPRIGAAVLAVGWMTMIFRISAIPGSPEPGPWFMGILWNGAHAPLYGLLALWWSLALPRFAGWPKLDRRGVALVLALTIAFGVIDEFHQRSTPGRDFSMLDVLTDFTGAACVLWIACFLNRDRARDAGLGWRVAAGIALCALAATAATFIGPMFPTIDWL
jgi:VanZ family protein